MCPELHPTPFWYQNDIDVFNNLSGLIASAYFLTLGD